MLIVGLVAMGCGDDDDRRPGDASSPSDSTGGRDTVPPSDAGTCSSAAECDDTFACTIDSCGVGGVCRHDALDERCGAGEMCSPAAGCQSGCTTNADCNNGMFCDGVETCVSGQCFGAVRPADCNDGNECTIDSCSDAAGGCAYELAAGCDAGVSGGDGEGRCPISTRRFTTPEVSS